MLLGRMPAPLTIAQTRQDATLNKRKESEEAPMTVFLKRAYLPPSPRDGYRALVDRLWPRGVSKEGIQLSEWSKTIAPSDSLRRSFHGGHIAWAEFRRRYIGELKTHRADLGRLARFAEDGNLTLVYGAHDEKRNHAIVIKQYLRMLGIS